MCFVNAPDGHDSQLQFHAWIRGYVLKRTYITFFLTTSKIKWRVSLYSKQYVLTSHNNNKGKMQKKKQKTKKNSHIYIYLCKISIF